jgi:phosphoribosyl-AMP cyclohydrolase
MDALLEQVKFDSAGLIPAIIQDAKTGQVLMMAWMNRDSLQKTLETGKTHFFSRSRNKLWLGHWQAGKGHAHTYSPNAAFAGMRKVKLVRC